MAIMLGHDALQGVLSMRDAIDLLECMLAHEAAGRTSAAPKFNTDFEGGALRMLFAVDYAAGYFVTKSYHTVAGSGARYVVSLYRLTDGELLAVLDGRLITDLRTGAASGVIARRIPLDRVSVGIIGSGHQAAMQLESLAAVYRIERASVYSPTATHCERFAAEMSRRFGFPVAAVATAEDVARRHHVVVTASNSRAAEPVLQGAWLDECRLLCAVGNTRAYAAEIDEQCFHDAALVVVDTQHTLEEAGELRRAVESGALSQTKHVTLAQIVGGARALPASGLVVFKSVGSALQDLALAARYYELMRDRAGITCETGIATARNKVRGNNAD